MVAPILALLLLGGSAHAATFEVGPGQPLAHVNEVPWEALEPGDTVRIHWRPEAYHAKWVICRRGTLEAPITVQGVPGPAGQLPVIDGRDAQTRKELNYWHEERSIIKIGGANSPPDLMPAFIVVENLEVRSARPPYAFTGRKGHTDYKELAAAIFVSKGEHITIRNCVLHDCGNGFMTSAQSGEILFEGCHVYDNGMEGSLYMHNIYTASAGITFQYNRLDPLRKGCPGNNLKDRSPGLVVRYNRIEGGNRQLDLVDAEDSDELRNDPRYEKALVYGNLLIEPDSDDNNQIVHFGGDSGHKNWYRPGALYFYNNTVVSLRSGTTTLFGLSTDAQRVKCWNNVVYTKAGGRHLALTGGRGEAEVEDNWLPEGVSWAAGQRAADIPGNRLGSDPGFVDPQSGDYRLSKESAARGGGKQLPRELKAEDAVFREYSGDRSSRPRERSGLPGEIPDLGAFEW